MTRNDGTAAGGAAPIDTQVRRVARCRITVAPHRWAFAEVHAADVAAHWQEQTAANPAYFNGTVLMLAACRFEGDSLVATAFRTEFRNYLYWRNRGFPDRSIVDGFGSAIVRARDGGVLLGRQRSGNVNTGLCYLPGGFIDERDVAADGSIDIAASVAREVREETGLGADDLALEPGFVATRTGPHLSIGVVFRSGLDSDALRRAVLAHIAADPDGELESVRLVHRLADLADARLADYCVPLLPVLLA